MFNAKINERWSRSIVKLITWRILISISQFVAGWYLSGNPWGGLGLVTYSLLINSLLYAGHERAWNSTDFGRHIKSAA